MKNKLVDKIIEKAGIYGVSINKLADDFGISWATMDGIMHGRTAIKPQTKQKLARALDCTIGDINELIRLSDQEGAITKAATSVMGPVKDTVNKVAAILADETVSSEHPEEFPATDQEDDEPEPDMLFPEDEEEEPEETLAEFKIRMKDFVLNQLRDPKTVTKNDLYQKIGKQLLDEILGGGGDDK